MVRFQSRKPAPNYLGRREQRRLFVLVLLLGGVFLLMREVRQPKNWNWFFLLTGGQVEQHANGAELAAADIDTRLPSEAREIEQGEFLSPLPKGLKHGADHYFPGVKPEFFKDVRDDTVFRAAEHSAFFNLLEVLKNTGDEALKEASTGPAAFVQLFQQPEEYRGELVTVRGTVRAAYPSPVAENQIGLEQFYQTWIQPHDNKNMLIVVYTIYLPKNFPTGANLAEEVEVTGFSYKRWAYRAKDTIRTAPLVLARNLAWNPPVAAPEPTPRPIELLGVGIGAALIAAVVIVTMLSRGSPPARRGFQLPSQANKAEVPPTGEEIQRMLEARAAEAEKSSHAS